VLLSGFFTGGVLALQSAATLSEFGATAVTGRFVSLTMIRELGPVLTGIMVAGRNASSMASELGSMVVTEQIDAMRALGVDPMRKLVTPRIFACISMLFFLTILADAFGILGGGFVTVFHEPPERHCSTSPRLGAPPLPDIIQGLVKPLVSGFIIASIGCFYGMRTTGGTEGVGRSTIQAVVFSSVIIIFADFLSPRCCSPSSHPMMETPAHFTHPATRRTPAPGIPVALEPGARRRLSQRLHRLRRPARTSGHQLLHCAP
jgi:phospholipid/cholesterol/gamma-HCH transport system permease protein